MATMAAVRFWSSCVRTKTLVLTKHMARLCSSETNEFEGMLKSSPLMRFGRPRGKTVMAKVIDRCNDDLYVDFGGKFHAVVKVPHKSPEAYQIGTAVRVIVKQMEVTGCFLGQDRHMSLNEAEVVLVGLS